MTASRSTSPAGKPRRRAEQHAPVVRADELTSWAISRLVVRFDAHGSYTTRDGSVGQVTVWRGIDRDLLKRHFGGEIVVGAHSTAADDSCKWLAIDIDCHDDADDPDENRRDALALFNRLRELGFDPLLTESNGKGGFHLRVLLASPVTARVARRFGLWLLHDVSGDCQRHEVFPKQESVQHTEKKLGNWVRIPGRHHKRDFWTTVWNGSDFVSGHSAIDIIVAHAGDDPSLIPPDIAQWKTPQEQEQEHAKIESEKRREEWEQRRQHGELRSGEWNGDHHDKMRMAENWTMDQHPSISGQRGHDRAFAVACGLLHGFDLSPAEAEPIFRDWNQSCEPPWSDAELQHKLNDADRTPEKFGRPRGHLLYRGRQKRRNGIVESASDDEEPVPEDPVEQSQKTIELTEWRDSIMKSRIDSIGTPGVYLDRSPTGAGKSTADAAAIATVVGNCNKAMSIQPTHANCQEVEFDLRARGLDAVKYPARLDEDIEVPCPRCNGGGCDGCGAGMLHLHRNCWNEDAATVEEMGLDVVSTLCTHCQHSKRCKAVGYLGGIIRANEADVAIATHQRAAVQGIRDLSAGRDYVSIEEDAVGLIRPTRAVMLEDLSLAVGLLNQVHTDPRWLNWFGKGDTDKIRELRGEQHDFLLHLLQLAETLCHRLEHAETGAIPQILPSPVEIPKRTRFTLFVLMRAIRVKFSEPPWSVLLDFVDGSLHSLSAVVSERPAKGGGTYHLRSLVAVRHNAPRDTLVCWFNDATAEPDRIAALLDRPVKDVTPDGRIAHHHPPVQVRRDITRNTSRKTVRGLVRALMARHRDRRNVGIICHKTHVSTIRKISEPFKSRLARVVYFGEGPDRGSNDWYRTCDLILIVGTPRVGDDSIRQHLVQCGEHDAAAESPEWTKVRWRAQNANGQPVTIETSGYRHPCWRKAHRELVEAAIAQAIGRGRGILSDGIRTVASTCDPCGLTRIAPSEWGTNLISDSAADLLQWMVEEGRVRTLSLIDITKSFCPNSDRPDRWYRRQLGKLVEHNILARTGPKSGPGVRWSLTSDWLAGPAEEAAVKPAEPMMALEVTP